MVQETALQRERHPSLGSSSFIDVVRPRMIEQFGYKNPMQVPSSRRSSSIWASAKRWTKVRSTAAELAIIAGQAGDQGAHLDRDVQAARAGQWRQGHAAPRMYEFIDSS